MVLFDSLNRKFLPPYGSDWVHAPNFARLAERSVTFDTCYAGSMPCMPARRELHTGRHNFLDRSWGPLEPFDDSIPELLSKAGVYTHLVTDHQHYWEDGGATYHGRYDTFEFFRGQEGDPWKGHVADPMDAEGPRKLRHKLWRQDQINRQYLQDEADHPQTLVFDAALEFMGTNRDADNWFLQVECFDPHEPFFSYDEHRRHYAERRQPGLDYDWPDYKRASETPEEVEHARAEYAALLSMCDASLGRVLDRMDAENLWEDTLLIVCTDHGFLLGEHGWWGKNVQPWFDENIHTPLFVWDPRSGIAGERREALVQTVDLGPSVLDFFDVAATERMQGSSITPVLRDDTPIRESGLFGSFGGHVNVTDGRYVYMRASASAENAPLYEHTLMPTHMATRFAPAELKDMELVGPLAHTQGVQVLRMPGTPFGNSFAFGTRIYDVIEDPEQQHPIVDDELELTMVRLLLTAMRRADAPASQYERLGLPAIGEPDGRHLLVRQQWHAYERSLEPIPDASEFASDGPGVGTLISELSIHPELLAVLRKHLGPAVDFFGPNMPTATVLDLAAFTPSLRREGLEAIHAELRAASGITVVSSASTAV